MMSRIRSSRKLQQTEGKATSIEGTSGSHNSTIGFDSYLCTDEDDGHYRNADAEAGYGGMGYRMEDTRQSSIIVSQPSVPLPAVHTHIRTSQQEREGRTRSVSVSSLGSSDWQ